MSVYARDVILTKYHPKDLTHKDIYMWHTFTLKWPTPKSLLIFCAPSSSLFVLDFIFFNLRQGAKSSRRSQSSKWKQQQKKIHKKNPASGEFYCFFVLSSMCLMPFIPYLYSSKRYVASFFYLFHFDSQMAPLFFNIIWYSFFSFLFFYIYIFYCYRLANSQTHTHKRYELWPCLAESSKAAKQQQTVEECNV